MGKGLISKLAGAGLVLSLVFGGVMRPYRGSELPQPELASVSVTYQA